MVPDTEPVSAIVSSRRRTRPPPLVADQGGAALATTPEPIPSLRVARRSEGKDLAYLINNESDQAVSTRATFPTSGTPADLGSPDRDSRAGGCLVVHRRRHERRPRPRAVRDGGRRLPRTECRPGRTSLRVTSRPHPCRQPPREMTVADHRRRTRHLRPARRRRPYAVRRRRPGDRLPRTDRRRPARGRCSSEHDGAPSSNARSAPGRTSRPTSPGQRVYCDDASISRAPSSMTDD